MRFQRLNPKAIIPTRAHPGDAGLDLCALNAVKIAPGQRVKVATGIAIELPAGHAGLVVPRSGLAAKHGLSIVNAPGLIDEGYRGELQILLLNTDQGAPINIVAGERIAQLVIVAVSTPQLVEVDDLEESARGEQGFGSSGSAP